MSDEFTGPIVVACDDASNAADRAEAASLADELNLELVSDAYWTEHATLAIKVRDGRVAIVDASQPDVSGVGVDLNILQIKHGRVQVSRKQPLARAFGNSVHTIVDATAGLGQDSLLFAAMGFEVLVVERSAIVAAILRNGIARALDDGRIRNAIEDRLTMQHADAIDLLPTLTPKPDAVYIDPMFPPKRRRSTLAKKPMRILRALVGHDDDAVELLMTALSCVNQRVVIKRPDHAPPIIPKPTASYEGKLIRYDVYHANQVTRLASLNLKN